MLYSSHQKGINQLSFKIELGTLKFCGNACKFQNSSPSLPGLTQNPFWLPYWINMMRLSLLRCIVSLLATSVCAKKSPLYIWLDRTILFLQLLTLVQVTGKSHPPQTITPRPVIPPKSTHSSRLFESTQDLILPEGSYYCDTYFGFIKQTTILALGNLAWHDRSFWRDCISETEKDKLDPQVSKFWYCKGFQPLDHANNDDSITSNVHSYISYLLWFWILNVRHQLNSEIEDVLLIYFEQIVFFFVQWSL